MSGAGPAIRLPSPDYATIIQHLAWLCVPAQQCPSLRLEISWGEPASGPHHGKTFNIASLPDAASFAEWINRKGYNVYVGATLKRANTPDKGRTRAEHATLATCLPIDIDKDFVRVSLRVGSLAQPQVLVLTGHRPEPRGQLFVRLTPTSDLSLWEQLQSRVVRFCGGDENALGRNRLMRLAGTISYPSPAKTTRGYAVERTTAHFIPAAEYDVGDLLTTIPARSAPSRASAREPALPVASLRQRRVKPPVSSVEAALRALPDHYASEHSLWIRTGFALYDFDCGPHGMDLWRRFSRRCVHKAQATDFEKTWQGFGRPYTGHRVTFAWLLHEARRHGLGPTGASN